MAVDISLFLLSEEVGENCISHRPSKDICSFLHYCLLLTNHGKVSFSMHRKCFLHTSCGSMIITPIYHDPAASSMKTTMFIQIHLLYLCSAAFHKQYLQLPIPPLL